MDVGERSINAIAKACDCCWRFVKKCYLIVRDNLEIISNKNKCGRKKKTEKYLELESDIVKIIDEYSSTDPQFKTEKQFVRLTVKEIMKKLISTGKYQEGFMCASSLDNLINKIGYNLKKVQRCKPLKKSKKQMLYLIMYIRRKKKL